MSENRGTESKWCSLHHFWPLISAKQWLVPSVLHNDDHSWGITKPFSSLYSLKIIYLQVYGSKHVPYFISIWVSAGRLKAFFRTRGNLWSPCMPSEAIGSWGLSQAYLFNHSHLPESWFFTCHAEHGLMSGISWEFTAFSNFSIILSMATPSWCSQDLLSPTEHFYKKM